MGYLVIIIHHLSTINWLSTSPCQLATPAICPGSRFFQGRRVLVLGAGLGLAGFLCASCTRAREVRSPAEVSRGWDEEIWCWVDWMIEWLSGWLVGIDWLVGWLNWWLIWWDRVSTWWWMKHDWVMVDELVGSWLRGLEWWVLHAFMLDDGWQDGSIVVVLWQFFGWPRGAKVLTWLDWWVQVADLDDQSLFASINHDYSWWMSTIQSLATHEATEILRTRQKTACLHLQPSL